MEGATLRTEPIPFPRLLSRPDGLLALVASAGEERQLRGSWTPIALPSAQAPFTPDMIPSRERLGGLFVAQGVPIFLRIVSQYDVGLDATIWRIDAWTGKL